MSAVASTLLLVELSVEDDVLSPYVWRTVAVPLTDAERLFLRLALTKPFRSSLRIVHGGNTYDACFSYFAQRYGGGTSETRTCSAHDDDCECADVIEAQRRGWTPFPQHEGGVADGDDEDLLREDDRGVKGGLLLPGVARDFTVIGVADVEVDVDWLVEDWKAMLVAGHMLYARMRPVLDAEPGLAAQIAALDYARDFDFGSDESDDDDDE